MKRIKGLDTLRAFAVIFVVKAHWGPVFGDNDPLGKFFQAFIIPDGGTGVHIFFVLSGFLITAILLDAKKAGNNTERFFTLKNFIARRALRIFPIYYLLICILYFQFPDIKAEFVYFATYTSNILSFRTNSWNSASHTWTLAVEEQFYIVWPWLILFVKDKYLKYMFAATIVIGIVSTFWVEEITHHMGPLLMVNNIDAFGIGGLYAYARLSTETCKKFERIIKKIVPLALVAYLYWKTAAYTHVEHGIFMYKTADSVISIWLIILVINNRSERVRKYFLENRVLNFIGKISYGIYLYHPYFWRANTDIASFINEKLDHYPALRSQLTCDNSLYIYDIILLILVCWLSYILIEQPLLSLKKIFKYVKPRASQLISPGPNNS